MSIDKNSHLKEVLDTHRMCHVQAFVDKFISRREEIKVKMSNHYGNDKYSSFCSGSFAKHTATNVKFDLDLVEPFKRSAFGILQEMFDSVYDFLVEEYKDTGVTVPAASWRCPWPRPSPGQCAPGWPCRSCAWCSPRRRWPQRPSSGAA